MKALIFDCFGVLTTDVWREFLAKLPPDLQRPASDTNKAYDAGFVTTEEYLHQIEQITGVTPPMVESSPGAAKNLELLEYIAQKKPDFKIGLLSNIGTDWITEHFLTRAEQQQFDVLVFSHHVGLAKPDPRIFEVMAERLQLEPSECLMVDDIEANSIGARIAGMQAVTYEDFEQAKRDIETIIG